MAGEPFAVEVAAGDGWSTWTEVATFAGSGPEDRHLMLDRAAAKSGSVRLPAHALVFSYGHQVRPVGGMSGHCPQMAVRLRSRLR